MEVTIEWDIWAMKRINSTNGVHGMVLCPEEGENAAERESEVLGKDGCGKWVGCPGKSSLKG